GSNCLVGDGTECDFVQQLRQRNSWPAIQRECLRWHFRVEHAHHVDNNATGLSGNLVTIRSYSQILSTANGPYNSCLDGLKMRATVNAGHEHEHFRRTQIYCSCETVRGDDPDSREHVRPKSGHVRVVRIRAGRSRLSMRVRQTFRGRMENKIPIFI